MRWFTRIEIIWSWWTINGICLPLNVLITAHLTTQWARLHEKWLLQIKLKFYISVCLCTMMIFEVKPNNTRIFWMKAQPDFSSWMRIHFCDVYKLLTVSFVLHCEMSHIRHLIGKKANKNKNTISICNCMSHPLHTASAMRKSSCCYANDDTDRRFWKHYISPQWNDTINSD